MRVVVVVLVVIVLLKMFTYLLDFINYMLEVVARLRLQEQRPELLQMEQIQE